MNNDVCWWVSFLSEKEAYIIKTDSLSSDCIILLFSWNWEISIVLAAPHWWNITPHSANVKRIRKKSRGCFLSLSLSLMRRRRKLPWAHSTNNPSSYYFCPRLNPFFSPSFSVLRNGIHAGVVWCRLWWCFSPTLTLTNACQSHLSTALNFQNRSTPSCFMLLKYTVCSFNFSHKTFFSLFSLFLLYFLLKQKNFIVSPRDS